MAQSVLLRSALRRTALLLALACVWMSSGATLRHTDDLSALRTFAAGRSAVAPATPAAAETPCVAHEWMNAWQTLSAARSVIAHVFIPLAVLRQAPSPAPLLGGSRFVCLRGPPSLFV